MKNKDAQHPKQVHINSYVPKKALKKSSHIPQQPSCVGLQVLIWIGSKSWLKAAEEKDWVFQDFDQTLLNNAFTHIRAGVLPQYHLQQFVSKKTACTFSTSQNKKYGALYNASEPWGFWPAEPSSESFPTLNPPPDQHHTLETTVPILNSIDLVHSSPLDALNVSTISMSSGTIVRKVRVHYSTHKHALWLHIYVSYMGPAHFLTF